MNRILYVSKSRLENTLEEYNTIYSSVTTWRSRMETQNSNIAASNEGATTETYTEKTTAYNDNELSDFSGHVNVMSCALVEALTKTRGLIARSEDFVNILKGESAESSDTYSNISSTGDVASYYDNFCSQEGFTGAIKDNTESITDLGIKEEENLTGIEDELKHLKTISVDISGYATHIRDCITKQNYTSPLYDSLRAYCIDVAVMHDYVKRIRDTYFPVLDGPREHNRSYNYDGAPTDDKENIYASRIKELGFSERDIEVLKRYTGLTAEQLYNQLSHMPGAEIANMLNQAYAKCGSADFDEKPEWYGAPMQLDGTTEQEIALSKALARFDNKIPWNQEKVDALWEACEIIYDEYGIAIDPRLMLSIIIWEGTGSFNTSSENLAADGMHGAESDYAKDLIKANDLIFGKVLGYMYYHEEFEAAIPENSDFEGRGGLFDYLNWQTPIVRLKKDAVEPGIYASDSSWGVKVRNQYEAFVGTGSADEYTEYLLGISKEQLDGILDGIDMKEFQFEPKMNGTDSKGNLNDTWTIVAS